MIVPRAYCYDIYSDGFPSEPAVHRIMCASQVVGISTTAIEDLLPT